VNDKGDYGIPIQSQGVVKKFDRPMQMCRQMRYLKLLGPLMSTRKTHGWFLLTLLLIRLTTKIFPLVMILSVHWLDSRDTDL